MRYAAAILAFVLCSVGLAAGADGPCEFDSGGSHFIEWRDGVETYGARLVARQPNWKLSNGLAYHAISTAFCESCRDDQIRHAYFWLGVGAKRDLKATVAPDSVHQVMATFPFNMGASKFAPESEPMPILMDGAEGFARLIRVQYPDAKSGQVTAQVMAVAVAKDCFFLFGVLFRDNAADLSSASLEPVAAAFGFEHYQPEPRPRVAIPLGEPLLLGDARKRQQGETR